MSPTDHCSSCGVETRAEGSYGPLCPRCAFELALSVGEAEPASGFDASRSTIPPAGPPDSDPSSPASESERIGPYRLRHRLGEGGMGIVWEALQEEPVRRRVALKQIKLGMDSAQVLARFESERQALALMSHPHIAQVYDAGHTSDGRPYFAMEYVEGTWITRYCDDQRLTVPRRLQLFMLVCGAIQHAHHKGVIHRDVKPSNILVHSEAGQPIPKVIDFGVAKAVGAHLTERTLLTRVGQSVGTPAYMSPEQSGPAGFDVDTRTDVYSLGVVLYEILTGRLPFEAPPGDEDALRRLIREDDPVRPSARVAGLGAEATEIARRRGVDTAALVRSLRGDLDWIVLKALDKDRGARYGSPEDLASDIRRHLAREPVLAGPPGAAYRITKFVRRHTLGVAAGSAIALTLLATAVGMTVQARRLARERDRANKEALTSGAALRFLTDTFRLSDPEHVRGETITAREVLDRGAAQIESALQGSPEGQATLMLTIGRTYGNLGLFDRAEPLVRRAAAIRSEVLGARHPLTLEATIELSSVLRQRDLLDEAEALARGALTALSTMVPADDATGGFAHLRLGEVLRDRGKLEDAEPHLRAALDGLGRALGPDDRVTLSAATALGDCLSRRGRYDEAEPLFRRTLDTQRRLLGNDDVATAASLNDLAVNCKRAGRNAEAEALFRESLETLRRVVGNAHPSTCTAASNLGTFLSGMGRLDEAEPLIREALEGRRRLGGPRSPAALGTLAEWAGLQRDRGNLDEAERSFREALDGFRAAFGDAHPQTARMMNNLADLLRERGRLEESETYYRATVENATRVFGEAHPNTLTAIGSLGEVMSLEGRHEEALPLLTGSLEGLRKALPPKHLNIGVALRKYGACLTGMRRFEEAEKALLEAHEVIHASVGDAHPRSRAAVRDLVALYDAWGKRAAAAQWRGLSAAR